jgi:hypothetical protein
MEDAFFGGLPVNPCSFTRRGHTLALPSADSLATGGHLPVLPTQTLRFRGLGWTGLGVAGQVRR